MGYDDDGFPVIAHIAQNREKLVCLLRGQNSGRLIQDQDIRVAVENLDDLHGLLLGHGHIVDLLVRIQIETIHGADLTYAGGGGL